MNKLVCTLLTLLAATAAARASDDDVVFGGHGCLRTAAQGQSAERTRTSGTGTMKWPPSAMNRACFRRIGSAYRQARITT